MHTMADKLAAAMVGGLLRGDVLKRIQATISDSNEHVYDSSDQLLEDTEQLEDMLAHAVRLARVHRVSLKIECVRVTDGKLFYWGPNGEQSKPFWFRGDVS
jgi:hypothetical protein